MEYLVALPAYDKNANAANIQSALGSLLKGDKGGLAEALAKKNE